MVARRRNLSLAKHKNTSLKKRMPKITKKRVQRKIRQKRLSPSQTEKQRKTRNHPLVARLTQKKRRIKLSRSQSARANPEIKITRKSKTQLPSKHPSQRLKTRSTKKNQQPHLKVTIISHPKRPRFPKTRKMKKASPRTSRRKGSQKDTRKIVMLSKRMVTNRPRKIKTTSEAIIKFY